MEMSEISVYSGQDYISTATVIDVKKCIQYNLVLGKNNLLFIFGYIFIIIFKSVIENSVLISEILKMYYKFRQVFHCDN